MRMIHTSDWHLGRGFHGVGLLDAQAAYLDHLVEVVQAEGIDAVLVSGDIYDRALPAPDTVALLDDALTRLMDAGATVVLSSGNHDSAVRLGFGARVLAKAGLHIRTDLAAIGVPVDLGDAVIYPLPYLEPALSAEALGADEATHASVLRAAMGRVRADARDRGVPTVVVAHAFVTGATTSESERDISVGGVAAVPTEVFAGVDYAALGHLHGPQEVDPGIRYSGSPVAMSFSETGHQKSSVLLTVDGGKVRCETIAAPVRRHLARLRGTLDDLLADVTLKDAEDAWCQVTLTDAVRPLGAMERVRRRFPHTLQLEFEQQVVDLTGSSYTARVKDKSDIELCCDFLDHVRGGHPATDDERGALRGALEGSRVGRAGQDDEGGARAGAEQEGAA
ncbi:exonuclease SbcCD subunit D [Leekyejoonella antrihumi]|uniref:Nuclease SbcCD subunit D n=1 Tax=Leekyejoonella antrihumi TaxID=1660198 RepID=A0A563E2P1_9MICO|nr:exonuclease SbcCD subunit D [Leekyejoonella antrihumi]TWP36810.1 exonuclease SbcCD subunit D [Leekyejoonella antrihumi]